MEHDTTPHFADFILSKPRVFTIASTAGPMVTFTTDGAVEFGPHYEPTEAAREFWKALAYMNPLRDRLATLEAQVTVFRDSLADAEHCETLQRQMADTLLNENVGLRAVAEAVAHVDSLRYGDHTYCVFRCGGRLEVSDEGTHSFVHGSSCPTLRARKLLRAREEQDR